MGHETFTNASKGSYTGAGGSEAEASVPISADLETYSIFSEEDSGTTLCRSAGWQRSPHEDTGYSSGGSIRC